MKRLFDLFASLLGVILFSPLLLLLAAAVRWSMGSPVFFRQKRPGFQGKPFFMFKFRTMRDASDAAGNPLPDEKRLTRLGIFLRKTSLDEIPELFNIVRGEMSFVGPRPLRMEYLDRYTPEQARRHYVPPGVTGWAQINGRNAIGWEKKFELDLWYVDHRSFWLDLKIIFLTFWQVVSCKDISAADHATMPEFMGTPKPDKSEASKERETTHGI
jgi:lipopolysaccharide/colanic/teichoic acid biosynthesis glycosyltransferase